MGLRRGGSAGGQFRIVVLHPPGPVVLPPLLSLLRCPHCGGELGVDPDAPRRHRGDALWSGVLACACCAYPVVEGIPCVRTGDDADEAMRHLHDGRDDDALLALLGLAPERRAAFAEARHDGDALTFRRALALLSPNAAGTYLLYRFSDPTFLASSALLGAVARGLADDGRPVFDLCCGTGHLARAVSAARPSARLVMADLAFWKVWLARRFVAPECEPLCCDANEPLPFAADTFALAYCADAFHYVWQRRRCADELSRLVGARGAAVLAHAHNALVPNHSAGMPLAPATYAALFERAPARLFRDSALLEAALGGASGPARPESAEALADEAALSVVATNRPELQRLDAAPGADALPGSASLNPLYAPDAAGGADGGWRLCFPSAEYEAEFGAALRYLPERATIDGAGLARAAAGDWDDGLRTLLARRVLLDLPARYL